MNFKNKELIENIEATLVLKERFKGDCSTCIHYYKLNNIPLFMIDFGKCKKGESCFYKKVRGFTKDSCPSYEENVDQIESLKCLLNELKADNNI